MGELKPLNPSVGGRDMDIFWNNTFGKLSNHEIQLVTLCRHFTIDSEGGKYCMTKRLFIWKRTRNKHTRGAISHLHGACDL